MSLKKNSKISVIVHDLSANPIVRAYPIILALQRLGYQVEVVGFLIGTDKVYSPYAGKLSYKTVRIKSGIVSYFKGLPKLLRLIEGDIIYAFKPRMTSYFVGLLKSRFGIRKKLLLDIEDDELCFSYKNKLDFFHKFFLRDWANLESHRNLLLLHLLLFPARIRTVVSTNLQKRYGGKILLHGPDDGVFNPKMYNKYCCRQKFNLPRDKILLLFAGIPHRHKGINIIANALKSMNDNSYVFVGAGPSEHEGFVRVKKELGENCILLGSVENDKMPELLAAVDIVPTLQLKTKFTESQIPAKLLEAMAMGKIIIATDASDIGLLLGKGKNEARGYLIDFDDEIALMKILKVIKLNPMEAKIVADNAHKYYLNNASISVNMQKLRQVLLQ